MFPRLRFMLFLKVGSSMAILSDTLISSYEQKSVILHCLAHHCKFQEHNPNVKRGLSASQALATYFLSNNCQKTFYRYNSKNIL
jgi:hypothetical protein